jgi:hypothetical protein
MLQLKSVSGSLAALTLAAVMSGCGGPVGGSAATHHAPKATQTVSPAPADLSADFESGTLKGWSSTAAATVTSKAAANGKFGAQISTDQGPGYLNWSSKAFKQGLTNASLRAYVQVVSRGTGQSVDLITIKDSNLVNNFDFFVTADTQRFKWDLYRGNTGQSAFRVAPGHWYLVEVQCQFAGTSYNARVRIDGVDQGMITSSGQVPATVESVWLGTAVPKTHMQRYDDVALRLADSWPGYLGGVTK